MVRIFNFPSHAPSFVFEFYKTSNSTLRLTLHLNIAMSTDAIPKGEVLYLRRLCYQPPRSASARHSSSESTGATRPPSLTAVSTRDTDEDACFFAVTDSREVNREEQRYISEIHLEHPELLSTLASSTNKGTHPSSSDRQLDCAGQEVVIGSATELDRMITGNYESDGSGAATSETPSSPSFDSRFRGSDSFSDAESLAKEVLSLIRESAERSVAEPLREELGYVTTWLKILATDHKRAQGQNRFLDDSIRSVEENTEKMSDAVNNLLPLGPMVNQLSDVVPTVKQLSGIAPAVEQLCDVVTNLPVAIQRITAQAVCHETSEAIYKIMQAQQTAMVALVDREAEIRASASTAVAIDYHLLSSMIVVNMNRQASRESDPLSLRRGVFGRVWRRVFGRG
ncbi:hypothetical protein GMORB2_0174 [Geosmithia morbida]|uniref:Uncharacterized protein n=1 Tax=Geosmithia morbida TaxID=1094350 RepID=A0A9P5D3P8_9HYPO|nr:uncharacterized protein GMORB2_0174 [Geosmithia morbida]KAF4126438.1 hypothetical protein GMORB2_0174 [Geosmithia morbida]